MTFALMRGGREFFGWSQDRQILASIFDAVNVNTRATGQWAKKPPDLPEWPRPKPAATAPVKKGATLRELYSRLARR